MAQWDLGSENDNTKLRGSKFPLKWKWNYYKIHFYYHCFYIFLFLFFINIPSASVSNNQYGWMFWLQKLPPFYLFLTVVLWHQLNISFLNFIFRNTFLHLFFLLNKNPKKLWRQSFSNNKLFIQVDFTLYFQ